MAVPVTLPYTLTNGTTADANQVMGDFNALVTALQNAAAASGANNDITALNALTTPLTPSQGGTNVFTGATAGGTANALTLNVTPNSFTLVNGVVVTFQVSTPNTGAATLDVNGTGAVGIIKDAPTNNSALIGDEMQPSNSYMCIFTIPLGWVLINPSTENGGFGTLAGVNPSGGVADLTTAHNHFAVIGGGSTVTSMGVPASAVWPIWFVYVGSGGITFQNGANLACPNGQTLACSQGDFLIFQYNGANVWTILHYFSATYTYQRLTTGRLVTNQFGGQNVTNLVLANGANNNVALTGMVNRITGPSGGFSITGMLAPSSPVSSDFCVLQNISGQQMTLSNVSGSSSAANQIYTMTGADVVLRAGSSSAFLVYSPADHYWILISYN